jgi:two-component system, OmpR family, sensor histidine kinase MprB
VRLRTRLTVVASVAVAVAVALTSAGSYALVRHELRNQIDGTLRRVEAGRGRLAPDGLRDEARRPVPRDELRGNDRIVQLVQADGTVVRPANETARLPVEARDRAVAAGARGAFLRDADASGTHVRMITVPAGSGTALQVGRSLAETDSTLRRLKVALILVALFGVALAAGLGLAVSRAALKPVASLTGAAEHIAETQDLGASIEVRGRDELARLATSFNAMLAALEESRQQQRQLVADASHELRTPLTSLRTNIEVLARQQSMPVGEREQLLVDVTAQLEEFSLLVGDLVELARDTALFTDEGLTDLDLDDVVARAVDRARLHAPRLAFATKLTSCVVRGRRALLDRALANVLDNACKWSRPDGMVEVTLTLGASAAEVTVRDHGPGIPAADLPHVFDRFYRASSARSMPGSGLGLAIVRRATEVHGGVATVEAAPGGGTLVRLRLPAVATAPEFPVPRPVPTRG